MYYADPPVTPDLGFYKEVFRTLVKYEDRYIYCVGVGSDDGGYRVNGLA